jgi:hypothetical protein
MASRRRLNRQIAFSHEATALEHHSNLDALMSTSQVRLKIHLTSKSDNRFSCQPGSMAVL